MKFLNKNFLYVILIYFFLSSILIIFGNFYDSILGLSYIILIVLFLFIFNYNIKEKPLKLNKKEIIIIILLLFLFSMITRSFSILLYNFPYEKIAVIVLIFLTVILVEKEKLSSIGLILERFHKGIAGGILIFSISFLLTFILALFLVKFFFNLPFIGINFSIFLLNVPFNLLLVGISEESLFRGYMQTRLLKIYKAKFAIIIQASLFGIWHFVWHLSPLDIQAMISRILFTFVFGIVSGYIFYKLNNLIQVILIHGFWNSTIASLVFPQIEQEIVNLLIPIFILSYIVFFIFLISISLLTKKLNIY